jgi:tRNA(Ile)-lysidine synthase TilS/MesJ
MKRLLSFVRRAVDDYSMIEDGDVIAVGVSGGKDSLTLLETLAAMRRFYPKKYEVIGITIDMGFEEADFSPIREFCDNIGVKFIVSKTQIAKIIFDVRKEPNPCSLCAKLRRGALHAAAVEAGCNKVALGHHFDDAVETFMLNLFFEGRIGCFSPVSYLSNRKITLIRPLLYATEKDVQYYANKRALPVYKNPCPEDRNTEREKMKELLKTLEYQNKGLRHRIFGAMCKGGVDRFKFNGRYPDAGPITEITEEA